MAAPTTRIHSESIEREATGSLYLTVMGPDLYASHPLPDAGTVIVGRDEGAQIRITEEDASRKHLALHIGDSLEVEDLGSTNGTRVREKRIAAGQRVTVLPGEAIAIGWTILMFQRRRPRFKPRRLWPHGYFEGRLEEECERADRTGSTFAVLRLLVTTGPTSDAAGDILARTLRPGDVLAVYGPDEYEILLADTDREQAETLAADLERQLVEGQVTFRRAAAFYPGDGRTAQALIERASSNLRGLVGAPSDQEPLIESEPLRRVYVLAQRAAAGHISVLILGETGVGKEVLAKAIHRMSPRKNGPFVCINCAALTETLLESELFGHEKGAFTGAVAAKEGLLESAAGGTVFLDEIGEMPLGLQAKLLRVLETREVTRVGAVRQRSIDVRFVAATNRDLEQEITRKTFRQDLFFRLNGISMTLPPLRERTAELDRLARHFISETARALKRPPPRLTDETLELLRSYCWPGNIRELRNVMERAVLLSDGKQITAEDLPLEKMRIADPDRELAPVRPTPPAGVSVVGTFNAGRDWKKSIERDRIIDALAKTAGSQTRAAILLGVSRRTFCDWLKKYDIPRPRV